MRGDGWDWKFVLILLLALSLAVYIHGPIIDQPRQPVVAQEEGVTR